MLQVLVTNVFDAKVINAQAKPDGLQDVFPKAMHVGLFEVPMACKTEFQELVGKDGSLREVIHPLSDLPVDKTINSFFCVGRNVR